MLKNGVKIIPIFSVLAMFSCSNNFLDADYPNENYDADTIYIFNNAKQFNLDLDLRTHGPATWKLYQFPGWLEINPKEGKLNNNSTVNFRCEVKTDQINVDLGMYSYPLFFDIDNVGLLEKTVILINAGNPEIKETPSTINVDYNFGGTYQIMNSGYGILMWQVVDKPSWLQLQTTEGALNPHEYGIWNYTVDITGLDPGNYSGSVEIESNASDRNFFIQFNFKIKETGYFGGFKTGTFIDAKRLNSTDQVVVLTKDPNLMLFFHSNSPDADSIQLNGVPRSLALSEDENTLAVGFSNAEITLYNTDTHIDVATYPVNAVPISLEFGTDRWLYYIASSEYTNYMYSIQLDNGTVNKAKNFISGLLPLKKVRGKNLMVSSRPGYSPESLFIFDITGGETDSINEYWMSMNGFWLSDDGERIFTGLKKIYQIPEYVPGQKWTMDQPPLAGEFDLEENRIINYIAGQSSTNRIFVASGDSWYSAKTFITQLNGQTLVKQKSYTLSPSPSPDFPPGSTWWTKTLKMFPTTDGTALWLIQEYPAKYPDRPNEWTIQQLSLN